MKLWTEEVGTLQNEVSNILDRLVQKSYYKQDKYYR